MKREEKGKGKGRIGEQKGGKGSRKGKKRRAEEGRGGERLRKSGRLQKMRFH